MRLWRTEFCRMSIVNDRRRWNFGGVGSSKFLLCAHVTIRRHYEDGRQPSQSNTDNFNSKAEIFHCFTIAGSQCCLITISVYFFGNFQKHFRLSKAQKCEVADMATDTARLLQMHVPTLIPLITYAAHRTSQYIDST